MTETLAGRTALITGVSTGNTAPVEGTAQWIRESRATSEEDSP